MVNAACNQGFFSKLAVMKTITPNPAGRPPGRKRPTIRHVAQEAGVSIATVSGVLTQRADCRASDQTRAKVFETAKRLGYRPSLMAHALHGKKTMTIGLVAGMSAGAEIWGRAVTAFEDHARAQGYLVLSSYTQDQQELEDHVIDEMLHRQVDALAVYPVAHGPHERLRQIIREGFPVITFDTNAHLHLPADDVSIDQFYGGLLQAQHLVEIGRKRICLVNSEPTAHVNYRKTAGLEAGLAKAGLKLAGRMDLTHDWMRWSDTQPSIYQEIRSFIAAHRHDFDAFAAHGDVMALLVIRACVSLGLRVPHDVAVIGFNDILVAGLMSPELTTIRDPAEELGRQTASLLMQRLDQPLQNGEEPRRIQIRPELIIRQSTREQSS